MASKEKERTPFLRHMKWDEHLTDIRMSEDKRNLIHQLKAPARLDELGYYQLAKVVDDYIAQGMDIGWNHNNHARVRKHLVQGAHLSPNAVHDHWQPLTHNESPGKYARVIEKFFLVALRSLNGHPSAYEIPLTLVQKEAAGSLFEALSLPDTPEALYLFHRFSWSLLIIPQSGLDTQNPYVFVPIQPSKMAPKVVRCEPDGRWVVYHAPFADFPHLVHHSHPYYAILNAYLKFSTTEEKDMEEMLPEHKLLRDVVEKIHGLWLALHKKRMHPISEGRVDDDEFAGSGYDTGGKHGGDRNNEHVKDVKENSNDRTDGRQDGFGSIPMVSNTFAVPSSIGMPTATPPDKRK
ncbi:hypothetical protein PILCRDRAFT_14322 [Piloderma croceum F 1598]|uniref:HNH nuclease domain-containing protein n=1 Tax=Piloderma croceum (strain F 1598) TaxID=765440 RepID=A0A0C3BB36_PILCF|nr:hypothetical protein PILCRDRAFT_14322 [Piloderma croceum F 1598]